ncbi:MAG: delta-60 repeat domain-containing protein [Pirellulales bacterium]
MRATDLFARRCSPRQRRTRSTARTSGRVSTFYRLGSEQLEERRLLDAGGLDPTFDGDGRVLTDIGQSGSSDFGYDTTAYQSDGKVVVIGTSFQASTSYDFVVARYNADGSLDGSFGEGGIVTIDFGGTYDEGRGVAIDSAGRIVVAGISLQGGATGDDFAVARINSHGELDATFDGDGKQTIDFGGTKDSALGVVVDDQDNVILAGSSNQGGATGGDFAVARLTSRRCVGRVLRRRRQTDGRLWRHE